MTRLTGIHHIAVMASDIKKHIAFFSDVLGGELTALFFMHGVPGAYHGFVRLNDHCYFSIVQIPGVEQIPIELGKTHAGTGSGPSAAGTMQHLAFNVDTVEDLLAMRDRIRRHGVNVFGPIDHGMCQSIYFGGPDQMTLEIATSPGAMDPRAWIDPEVMALTGISAQEVERFKAPAGDSGEGPVPQPPFDPAKPHQAFPPEMYRQMLAMPDELLAQVASYPQPPVRV